MTLGVVSHVAVLEPKKLDTAFVEKPEGIDFRTKAGKEWRESIGSTLILDAGRGPSRAGNTRQHRRTLCGAGACWPSAQTEVALFAEHRTGLWIKGRVDALEGCLGQ
jgi:hypothetical protein